MLWSFKKNPFQVQRRPWRMVGAAVGAWLARKLFDPKAVKPPPPYLLQIALRPLEVVMEPFVPGASYQKKVFERFLQHALWSPVASVANQHFLAVGIPAAYPAIKGNP